MISPMEKAAAMMSVVELLQSDEFDLQSADMQPVVVEEWGETEVKVTDTGVRIITMIGKMPVTEDPTIWPVRSDDEVTDPLAGVEVDDTTDHCSVCDKPMEWNQKTAAWVHAETKMQQSFRPHVHLAMPVGAVIGAM